MSGQRSADSEESVAAGCALQESPARRRGGGASLMHSHNSHHQNNNGLVMMRMMTGTSSGSTADDNLLFAWGRGEDGQLGLGDTNDQDEPTYVDALRGVSVHQIACGSGHTVVLTTEGSVYTWYVRYQIFGDCF